MTSSSRQAHALESIDERILDLLRGTVSNGGIGSVLATILGFRVELGDRRILKCFRVVDEGWIRYVLLAGPLSLASDFSLAVALHVSIEGYFADTLSRDEVDSLFDSLSDIGWYSVLANLGRERDLGNVAHEDDEVDQELTDFGRSKEERDEGQDGGTDGRSW